MARSALWFLVATTIAIVTIASDPVRADDQRQWRRVKRQFFAPPSAECVITEAEVEQIVELTRYIDGYRRSSSPSSSSKASRKRPVQQQPISDECDRTLGELKHTLQNVMTRYDTLQQEALEVTRYEQLKAQQESVITEMVRQVDNLKREAEQRYKAEVEKLRNSLQRLQRRLAENLRLLEEERLLAHQTRRKLCVTYIQGGKVAEAASVFRALNGSYSVVEVLNDTYRGEAAVVVPLVLFYKALWDDAQAFRTIDALEELYRQVEHNNQLDRVHCREMFYSMSTLDRAYTDPVDVARVRALFEKLMLRLRALTSNRD
ncbi:uncharacterized protein LOC125952383 [Anopheles darlingi]|uniref:uncharacterized protein LOC125952383 n=1 Tax=Anopheles darlingi TaxID=43151 RepID=UPI0021000912|nr:uncharacterized protein LOC125952383 [Anopheles darlingi]